MLRTRDLDYDLPQASVATHPAVPRDAARLLVVSRAGGRDSTSDVGGGASRPSDVLAEAQVRDLPSFLRAGDLLVVNTTRVIPARFVGERADTRGQAEGLYLGDLDALPSTGTSSASAGGAEHVRGSGGGGLVWRALLKARRLKPGVRIVLRARAGEKAGEVSEGGGGRDGSGAGVSLELLARAEEASGGEGWLVRVHGAREGESSAMILERLGLPPLPPYIRAARKSHSEPTADVSDPSAYQTVYARSDQAGSVAAPTAGLHFTPELLARLDAAGVRRAEVVLHVGTGTFKPVESEYIERHPMHAEWCRVPLETAQAMARTRREGGRIIAVGTTSARTLESFPDLLDEPRERAQWTRILITPGHAWRNVDALMTNFHLPQSTLMAMVASLLQGASSGAPGVSSAPQGRGVARLLALYRHAISAGYRFYSYGDAMLIV